MRDHRICAQMTTLNEGLQQTWYHGRVASVGDTVHKFTPNLAIYFNNAFESAAALTNQLRAMLRPPGILGTKTSPTLEDVTSSFSAYQIARFPWVLEQYKLSHWYLMFITWDTWILKWNDRLLSRIIPDSALMKQVLESFKGVGRLEFLKDAEKGEGVGHF
jgi:2-polyprenyl-6-methoxyphenol hydroxylase-like FAD-dependent oxidoreductase